MLLTNSLGVTLKLLGSVYDHIDSYRQYLTTVPRVSLIGSTNVDNNLTSSLSSSSSTPSSSSFSSSLSSTHHYQYLLGAIQSLAQHLANSTIAPNTASVANGTEMNLANAMLNTGKDWMTSALALNNASIENETLHWPQSSVSVTGLIDGLPLPQDEATLNSELGLGPIRDPLHTVILMTILYLLILVAGLIGNVVTCVVIVRNRYMHTATNYYLFSLSCSDLLLLVLGLPVEIYQIWRRYPYAFNEAFCILRGFSSEASTNSSVLTITAFTVERYVAICHPLRAHTLSKLSRAIKFIVFIWLFGCLAAAPIAYQFGIIYDYMHNEVKIPQSAMCSIKRRIPYLGDHVFALQSSLVFVLPVTLIAVLYVLIGIKLRQSSRKNVMPKSGLDSPKVITSSKKSTKSGSKFSYKIGRRFTIRRLQSIPSYTGASLDSIEVFSNESMPPAASAKDENICNVPTIPEGPEGQCLIENEHQEHTTTTSISDRVGSLINHHPTVGSQAEFVQPRQPHDQIVLPSNNSNNTNVRTSALSASSSSSAPPPIKRLGRLHRFTSTTSSASVSSSGAAVTSAGCPVTGNSSSTSNLAQRRAVIKMLSMYILLSLRICIKSSLILVALCCTR